MSIFGINTLGLIIDIADNVLAGEIAATEGQYDRAIQLFEKAIEIEDSLAYNEPPDWFFSVRHHLGAALIKKGDYAKAEAVYRRDLELFRETGWALNGLHEALLKQGKNQDAQLIQSRFETAWAHADTKLKASKAL